MKKLLWVGDAACASGFARCTHKILNVLRFSWDVAVLGLNYLGDPHEFPYPIHPAWPGGDLFGVRRLANMVNAYKSDVVVIQNDPWNIPGYAQALAKATVKPKVVGFLAIDGENCDARRYLPSLDKAIFWTKFAQVQAEDGGYTGPSAIVPLGVDCNVYCPGDRVQARKNLGLPDRCSDAFIVGNVNRNQPRKRFDLMIRYFAKWYQLNGRPNAYLFLHAAPTGDQGVDCEQMAAHYGIGDRLILAEPNVFDNNPERMLVETYRAFDVLATTTQGEGWGLTTLEGMACGIPCIVPDWSALGEWAMNAARLVRCSSVSLTPATNVIGGVPDEDDFVAAIKEFHEREDLRTLYAEKALACARQDVYDWDNIGLAFADAISEYL